MAEYASWEPNVPLTFNESSFSPSDLSFPSDARLYFGPGSEKSLFPLLSRQQIVLGTRYVPGSERGSGDMVVCWRQSLPLTFKGLTTEAVFC